MSSSMLAVSNEEKIAAMEAESFGGTHCGAITGIPPTTVRELKSLWTVRDEGLLTDDQEERVRGWRAAAIRAESLGGCDAGTAPVSTMCAPWGSHPAVEKGPVTHPHPLDPLRILGCGKGPEDNGRPLALFRDIRGASAGGAVAWWKVEAAKDEPKRQETTEGDVGFEMVENGQTEGEGQNVLISEESLATEEG